MMLLSQDFEGKILKSRLKSKTDCLHSKLRKDGYIPDYPIKKSTEQKSTWESLAVNDTFPPTDFRKGS